MEYLRLKEAPEIQMMPEPESPFFWQSYMHLRASRNIGMGAGGIPFSEIMAYADHCEMSCPVERARLVRIIGEMDATEVEVIGAKRRG